MGQGALKHNIKKYYKNQTTSLVKSNQLLAHNQFITQAINLGALGASIWIFIMLYSFLKVEKEMFLSIYSLLNFNVFCLYVR